MTNAEVLAKTVALANAWFERELENSEITLRDLGATAAELERAIGPQGFWRRVLEQDRAEQIREVAAWLRGEDGARH